jgi:hypothetical protein
MNQQFLENYKGYNLYSSGDGIAWSDNGGWLNCVFDTVETAKYFIDRRKLFTDNYYNVIVECQSKAIVSNNGIVSVEIVNEFEIKK